MKLRMKLHNSLFKGLILSSALAAAPALFAATSFTQVTEVFPPDPSDGQFFGRPTAINDDVAVVGAPATFDWFSLGGDGAAYVFVKSGTGWVFQQKLVASDSNGSNHFEFGFAVDIAGNTIAVGAPGRRADGKSGAVYVFTRPDPAGPWTEQAIITSSTPRPFGLSVALRGGTLVAGALEDRLSQGGPSNTGMAFVFVRSGGEWIEQGNLMSDDIPLHPRNGISVGIRGNTVVVGAENPDFGPKDPSAVYVFSRQGTTWSQETKLSPANNSTTFGHSVSLSGGSLVAGDPNSSAASIYEHVGHDWQLTQTVVGDPGSQFGLSVAQREDSLLIGARRATVGGVQSGAAYLYGLDGETGTWTLAQTLSPPDGQTGDNYGGSVSLGATSAIVGAFRHSQPSGPVSGAAYIYLP
jgi:FG-GAP repeat